MGDNAQGEMRTHMKENKPRDNTYTKQRQQDNTRGNKHKGTQTQHTTNKDVNRQIKTKKMTMHIQHNDRIKHVTQT